MTDSLDIWTFDDQCRATVKGNPNVDDERPILTGMALGLNSTLSISEGNKKLPPCPMILFSNSEGVLQIYYYIHKESPISCCTSEVIPTIQVSQTQAQPSLPSYTFETPVSSSSNLFSSFLPSASSSSSITTTNGFSFNNTASTLVNPTQSKGTDKSAPFNFTPLPTQTTNTPSIGEVSKSSSTTSFNIPKAVQETSTKTTTQTPVPSISNNKKFLQTVNEFESKLISLKKPIPKPSDTSDNLSKSTEDLKTKLNNMQTSFQTSKQSIKTMTNEHIESITKIEDARHQIKSSLKENLYHLLKDRELDPWTQSRLDLIQTKYNELKRQLNVLLQLTRTTIHDKSSTTNDDENDNEDFIPELEISLDTNETMKQRIQKRIRELSHKVSETEKDLENICTKFNSKLSFGDSTFTKTTMSSDRPFHQSDAQILSYLQTNHPNVDQIQVPSTPVINLSSIVEQKKQSTNEVSKPITPANIQSSTLNQTNSPTIESESFKNMLRIVKTSIDIFSGVTSPEQLKELSNTIATSPLASTQKSNITPINKTPTIPKTPNLTKTSSVPSKTLNTVINSPSILQTPAKSVTSTTPTISVTPATPATQGMPFDSALKLQANKSTIQTATDLSKTQTVSTSGDSAIRQLLSNTILSPTAVTSAPSQSIIPSTTQNQTIIKPLSFGSTPSTSVAPVTSQPSLSTPATSTTVVTAPVINTQSTTPSHFGAPVTPASTVTTSAQALSPATKPIMSPSLASFGSKPTLGGTAFSLTSTASSAVPFGSGASANTGTFFGVATPRTSTPTAFGSGFGGATTTTTTTAATSTPSTSSFGVSTSSAPSPFGSGFAAPATTAVTTSAPTTSIFGGAAASSPFGSGFGSPAAATTSASSTGPFGSPAATTSTSAPSTGIFGSGFGSPATATTSAPSTGGFGSSTATTFPFGGGSGAPTATSGASPFGGFGGTSSTSTGTSFGGFGAATSTAPTSIASTSTFGSTGFGVTSTIPATSTASSAAGGSLFGSASGTSPFGSSFAGFGTQSNTSGPSTGFLFGGFGSTSAAPQPTSPFGSTAFGGASGQPAGFGTTNSSFGASSTQSTSSASFTNYRK